MPETKTKAKAAKRSMTSQDDMGFIVHLLGGERVFSRPLLNQMDAHEVILKGFPNKALTHLVAVVPVMSNADVMEKAVGISLRTFQRRKKESPTKPLSQEQSGRTWRFVEILAKAIRVFGAQENAENWLSQPAIGLDQRRPIDLIATTAGTEIVNDYLERLEYGVYT